jgi:O-acetyl-ADP-ribose deacetylase (regulator of RNase III)
MLPAPKITVTHGNIVAQPDCDGVVNAANKNLRAGSGVCGAIHDAAGKDLETFASRFAPLNVGEALATPAFNLPCRCIIHTVGPKYWADPTPEESLRRAIRSTLLLADENGLKRLAVPAISTGVYGYPPEEAVPIMVSEAENLRQQLKSLEEIRFVVRDAHLNWLFVDTLDRLDKE